MSEPRYEDGKVIDFDAARGVATVELETGRATLPAGAFFSGRPVRLPEAGDRIRAHVVADGTDVRVVVAALVRTG